MGQCLPIATPDTATYPGSDYYKLELNEYSQRLHTDLPATPLRGYRQVGGPNQYLGPVIIAQRDRPVRIKFRNLLTTDLPLPADTSYMGAGMVSDGTHSAMASMKRAAIHLHGGLTPWISDGTPHQWITPAGDAQPNFIGFKKGFSFQNVPDMVSGGAVPCAAVLNPLTECITPNLNDGLATLYWTNQQSGRMMFYHDHAYGLTRLNVYGGEAAGYLLIDPAEETALAAASVPGTIPDPVTLAGADLAHVLPLVIQDKTFVPDNGEAGGLLALTDPTWPVAWGKGSFWFPHVYMPNQFPNDPALTGANGMGRWDYAPWMNPAMITNIADTACTSPAYPGSPLRCPTAPNPSGAPEAFMDTPLVNGTAYPTVTLTPSAYRFKILNAANDRIMNLGLYYAATGGPVVTIVDPTGSGASATAVVNPVTHQITAIEMTDMGSDYTAPQVVISDRTGTGAIIAPPVPDATTGAITSISVTNGGSGYYAAGTLCKDGAVPDADIGACTEVSQISAAAHRSKINTTGPLPSVCTGAYTVPVNAGSGLATAALNPDNTLKYSPTGLPPATFCWPNSWPDDGNAGQHIVPNPISAGPPIIQIGAEGGLLPQAVVIPSTPMGFEYNRRSATVLNGHTHGLLMGPAERADVVVDFTAFAPTAGKSVFILYNDGAAPLPGFDPRNDYFTGDPDQTLSGGAPSTLPGYGPNTRTLMQIIIDGANTNAQSFNLSALMNTGAGVPSIFEATQDKIIVPEPVYPANNGGSAVTNFPFASDTGMTFPIPGPIAGVNVTNPGSGYTTAPVVTIAPPPASCSLGAPNCVQATAVANVSRSVDSLAVTTGSSPGPSPAGLYTTAPVVTLTGGGGTGATATANLAGSGGVKTVTISNQGRYSGTATVTFNAPPCVLSPTCVGATGTAIMAGGGNNRRVTGVNITNRGAGYTAAPVLTFSAGNGNAATRATGTATLGKAVATLTLTNPGSGYTSAPTVGFTGGGGTGAAASAVLGPVALQQITLTNPGNGYPSAPLVTIGASPAGVTATAVATLPPGVETPFFYKAVIEGFTFDSGRMNAQLGSGFAGAVNPLVAAAVPFGYVDPTSESFKDGETQLWRFVHMGIDVHYIHFHLFNVQLINRIGIDGSTRILNPNEVGWKETVRMNPFEDIIVALRPIKPAMLWDLPNSIRPMDVTTAIGTVNGPANCQNNPFAPPGGPVLPNCLPFTISDPSGNAVTVTNSAINYGWEYVYHCHLLGHEENDMMRPMSLAVAPSVPTLISVTKSGTNNNQRANLTWTDTSINETAFTIQSATSAVGPWTTLVTQPSTTGPVRNGGKTYRSAALARNRTFYFRVIANNVVGCNNTVCSNPFAGWLPQSADSPASGVLSVTTN